MSQSMAAKYIGKKYEEISKEGVEYKAYSLGYASGIYLLYDYIANNECKSFADELIKKLNLEDYIRNILEDIIMFGNREAQTKAEKIAEKLSDYKRDKRDKSELVMAIMEVLDKYSD